MIITKNPKTKKYIKIVNGQITGPLTNSFNLEEWSTIFGLFFPHNLPTDFIELTANDLNDFWKYLDKFRLRFLEEVSIKFAQDEFDHNIQLVIDSDYTKKIEIMTTTYQHHTISVTTNIDKNRHSWSIIADGNKKSLYEGIEIGMNCENILEKLNEIKNTRIN